MHVSVSVSACTFVWICVVFFFFKVCTFPQDVSVVLVRPDGSLKSPLSRLLSEGARLQLLQMTLASAGDLVLLAAGAGDHMVSKRAIRPKAASSSVTRLLLSCGLLMVLLYRFSIIRARCRRP